MYFKDTEILFPMRVIQSLRDLRGPVWQTLVDGLLTQPESAPDSLAFSLMMIRLCACLPCRADSYRALRGCTLCARRAVRNFRGTDADLIALWQAARIDVTGWLHNGTPPVGD